MDTLRLGFILSESNEGGRWIKRIYPFARLDEGDDMFPDHQIDIGPLVESVAASGEYYLVNCKCGVLECARISSGIHVEHDGDSLHWKVTNPKPERDFRFDARQYREAVFMLIDDLAGIRLEPDGYNEYGFYGLDHARFTAIVTRRKEIGQETCHVKPGTAG